MSAVTGKTEKAHRLSRYLREKKENLTMSEGETGAVSGLGMGH